MLDHFVVCKRCRTAFAREHGNGSTPRTLARQAPIRAVHNQHRGWFHSSLLTSVTTDDEAPYRAVLTHGFVLDGEGRKMSKTAGNVVSPQEIIKESGAEILRLWVASQDYQEDLRISKAIVKQLMEPSRYKSAVLKAQGDGWYPADLYLEGSDQHRGWFHSSLLTSVTTDDEAPYRAVLTHGFVLDGEGRKMSKTAGNVVSPQEIIKESGAEILRLWVASQDYQEDLRISKAIVKQLMDAYRKVRNTCRFLLSNLYDFDAAVHSVPHADLPELDQWALWRLGQLIDNVKKGYKQFQFRQVVHEIDYFCSTDMSSTYLDILKDRLYTFPTDSRLRRGSQTVLLEIVTALAKLMAPILSFTAEEIWQSLPDSTQKDAKLSSVHLAEFPKAPMVFSNPDLQSIWNYLFHVRRIVQSALEKTRRDKVIGSSLEATVVLQATEPNGELLKRYQMELPALFIVSQVEVKSIAEIIETDNGLVDASLGLIIDVVKAEGAKCDRCWNFRNDVGKQTNHSTLCGRCVEAVA